jgi:hypothetical protein
VASGERIFCALSTEFDNSSGRATDVHRIFRILA